MSDAKVDQTASDLTQSAVALARDPDASLTCAARVERQIRAQAPVSQPELCSLRVRPTDRVRVRLGASGLAFCPVSARSGAPGCVYRHPDAPRLTHLLLHRPKGISKARGCVQWQDCTALLHGRCASPSSNANQPAVTPNFLSCERGELRRRRTHDSGHPGREPRPYGMHAAEQVGRLPPVTVTGLSAPDENLRLVTDAVTAHGLGAWPKFPFTVELGELDRARSCARHKTGHSRGSTQ